MIKSIYYDNEEIINAILHLHCNTDIELDPTYSKGNFYKGSIKEPLLKFDINPQVKGVKKANAEKLPLEDQSINTMIFDPPFLATKGRADNEKEGNNLMIKRFGHYPTEKKLHQFYINALTEFKRILKPKGVLIFKCQDKVSSRIQYLSHVFIINEAEKLEFYTKDILLLLAKNRLVADWQKNQQHARKFHSYFLVFENRKKKVKYV